MAQTYSAGLSNHHQGQYFPQQYVQAPFANNVVVPPGTYLPGTPLTVGSHNVIVERYLSEGGFAHVYVVRLSTIINGTDLAVLKRVAVPDRENLGILRVEVDTMKRLKGHRNIVTYIDSHASHLKTGGYEVFLLMEYCSGGGLIDFMNTRLQNRFTESEILKIFSDVTEGVACMHYLDPPLLHRDLKVENVLISSTGHFKICDFGSSSGIINPGTTAQECRIIEDDIQRHTTMQYRSPEMVDVYRGLPIDEKSDIWALGVFLYKLCYYITPFEEQGQMAILHSLFKFPPHPQYSNRIKRLIKAMLQETPRDRPNIYLVVKETCSMRGVEIPIRNKYSYNAAEDSRRMPPPQSFKQANSSSSLVNVIKYEQSTVQRQTIPNIKPMRRGRLPPPGSAEPAIPTKQPPSPVSYRTDSKTLYPERISSQTNQPYPAYGSYEQHSQSSPDVSSSSHDQPSVSTTSTTTVLGRSLSKGHLHQPQPNRPVMVPSSSPVASPDLSVSNDFAADSKYARPNYVSTGTSTDDYLASRSRSESRSSIRDHSTIRAPSREVTPSASRRPSLDVNRSASFYRRPPSSNSIRSRPVSMFIDSSMDFLRNLGGRSGATSPANSIHSNTETYLHPAITGQSQTSEHIESNLEFLKSLDTGASTGSLSNFANDHLSSTNDKRNFSSGSGKHAKRSSISFSATKKLSGKFGEAFKVFEASSVDRPASPEKKKDFKFPGLRRSSSTRSSKNFFVKNTANIKPLNESEGDHDLSVSVETTGSGKSWEVKSQEVPSPVRDAFEQRRISQEEKRSQLPAATKPTSNIPVQVANEQKSISPISRQADLQDQQQQQQQQPSRRPRATSIQNRVQNLLAQSQSAPVIRTASGYGRYSDSNPAPQVSNDVSIKPLKRAETIGDVPDSKVLETYVVIEPISDLDIDRLNSTRAADKNELNSRASSSRFKSGHGVQDLAVQQTLLKARHAPHQSTSHIEIHKPQLFSKHQKHQSHRSEAGILPVRTAADIDLKHGPVRKPPPPPKPEKLKTGTPSPRRTARPASVTASNASSTFTSSQLQLRHDKDARSAKGQGEWVEEFNQEFPEISPDELEYLTNRVTLNDDDQAYDYI
ncbi:hypothetical protein V1514DRAFT_337689 [Lipomyces japonicus]|uniref:uncharacterized protein n=1 Tax=Lipomyces japonicus TaxID=56871 RepID=UPI0034CE629D